MVQIISRTDIGLRPPTQRPSPIYPTGWVLHWVGASRMNPSPTDSQSRATCRNIQNEAFTNGYSDIQYSFLVDPAGRIYEGRGWSARSAANGTSGSNMHLWSVCYLAGPGVKFTDAARTALLDLCRAGVDRTPAVATVVGHTNVPGVHTACPGSEGLQVAAWLEKNLLIAPVPPSFEEDDVTIVAQPKSPSAIGRTPTARAVPSLGAVLLENGARIVGDVKSGKNFIWRDKQVPAKAKMIGIAARPDGRGIVALYDLGNGDTATYVGMWK